MTNWMAEKVIVVSHWQNMLEIYPPELAGNLPSWMSEKAIYGGVSCWNHSAAKLLE